jgi:hypothetical protein
MSTGINPDLAASWLGTLRNTPYVVPITAVKLHIGDPGTIATASGNPSAVTTRMAASFAAPVDGVLATTGSPPQWNMTAAETISYISVWDALTSGTCLWIARLNTPQTVANGDLFTMGGGISLTILGLAA